MNKRGGVPKIGLTQSHGFQGKNCLRAWMIGGTPILGDPETLSKYNAQHWSGWWFQPLWKILQLFPIYENMFQATNQW